MTTKQDMKRKIIASGENILDILFENGQPVSATPGGSAFNSAVSLGRTGTMVYFIGETGDDEIGKLIRKFMQEQGVQTDFMHIRPERKTAVAIALLNEQHEAHYTFYRDAPTPDPERMIPDFQPNDILLFGSYHALCPALNQQTVLLTEKARNAQALVYYDINFRPAHRNERHLLMPAVERNCRIASIVRVSADDCEALFDKRELNYVYQHYLQSWCPILIGTAGSGNTQVFTPNAHYEFASTKSIHPVSTVGAGDNFNAGFLYALTRLNIGSAELTHLSPTTWKHLIACGTAFATHVCMRRENTISPSFDYNHTFQMAEQQQDDKYSVI